MHIRVAPFWLFFGIIGIIIANSKGRSGCAWFFICAIFGPIGLLIALVMPSLHDRRAYYRTQRPPRNNQAPRTRIEREEKAEDLEKDVALKRCPYCFEYIRSEAKKCKHCKSQL